MATSAPAIGRRAWTRRLASLATALAGVATIVSSLSPSAPARVRLLEGLEPDSAQAAAHAAGVLGGLATVWLALGVLQGRRSSGRAATVVLGVLALVHAAKGLDYEEALLGLAVALALHRALRGQSGSAALLGLLIALVAWAGAFAASLTVLLLSGGSPRFAASLAGAAQTVWALPAGIGGGALAGLHLLFAIAAGALVVAMHALLAPARPREGHDDAEHARAAALVSAHGEDSIAPFALRADKAFHFAAGGALAYRALRETAVVAGDPIGPDGCAGPVMASFLGYAFRNGWDVVLLGARDEQLPAYAGLGLRSVQVGLEAVVDPRGFDLASPSAKTVRKACARVRRHGWSVEVVEAAQLDGATIAELATVELAWRRRGHRRLYGFAMAHDRLWGAAEDATDVYALARSPTGELRAFQRYVRYRRGLSLDAMRRLDDEPNGIADSLVAAVIEHARAGGCEEVSLNFSGFAHVLAADTLPLRGHRLLRWGLRRLRGRFQLERLARFAGKFSPAWRPRYLVYTGRTRLPLAALRVLQAEAYLPARRARPGQDAWQPLPIPLTPGALAAQRR